MHHHASPVHAALQILLAQLAAGILVDSAGASKTFEVFFHQRLALGIVVQWEGPPLRRHGFGDDLAATWASESAHDPGDQVKNTTPVQLTAMLKCTSAILPQIEMSDAEFLI